MPTTPYFDDLKVGDTLPETVQKLTIPVMQRWVACTETLRRDHYDAKFAISTMASRTRCCRGRSRRPTSGSCCSLGRAGRLGVQGVPEERPDGPPWLDLDILRTDRRTSTRRTAWATSSSTRATARGGRRRRRSRTRHGGAPDADGRPVRSLRSLISRLDGQSKPITAWAVMTARTVSRSPSSARASRTAPTRGTNFAIRAHLPALKALDDRYEVAAVCTTRMESADEAAKRFDVPNAFDSVERMLEEMPELDIVCVSVKPASHYDVAMQALHAGKHVYREHPGVIAPSRRGRCAELAKSEQRPVHDRTPGALRRGGAAHGRTRARRLRRHTARLPVPPFRRELHHSAARTSTGGCSTLRRDGRPAYRTGHSLEHIMAVLGQDVTSLCADFTIKVPQRPAIDRPEVMLDSDQVDNMNYLLALGHDTIGTLQVSNTAWSGTGRQSAALWHRRNVVLGRQRCRHPHGRSHRSRRRAAT